MISIRAFFIAALIGGSAAQAELFVYEPFDYKPHNDEVFGRVEGRNGGMGFAGAWKDTGGRGSEGYAFIYDERGNPEDLYGGAWGQGKLTWDGVVDNLPTMGGYLGSSDWNGSGDSMNSTRKLSWSAGKMASKSGGVLWLSAVWHFPEGSFFAPVGIALASDDSGFRERVVTMNGKTNAIGTGNGRNFKKGMKRLNPMIWENGVDVASTPGTNIDGAKDNIILIKFEFGKTDKVSTWYFTEDQEITEEAFNENAIACSASIDEDSLDVLTIGTTRLSNAIDEIRIGNSFESVLSGSIPARREVEITRRLYDAKSDRYYLEWSSNPGENYGVFLAEDAGGYKPSVAAVVKAEEGKEVTSFGPFENPRKGDASLQFEIGLPDLTNPVMDRAWGNGNTINLHFSEPLLPTAALELSHYAVEKDGGGKVAVSNVSFGPGNHWVRLTTAEPLEAAETYSVTTRNLTDRANLELVEPQISFDTWDDDPEGVKVFILAGQSNMIGRGNYDKGQNDEIGGVGSLRAYLKENPSTKPWPLNENGDWQDVENMNFFWNRAEPGGSPRVIKGDMTVGYGSGPDCIGPEYGFAWSLHQVLDSEPVLVIKAAWGGKSLHSDFRSPSAAAERDVPIGPYYLQMMESVRLACEQMGEDFPEFKGKGYQIAGMGWHQGYNDMLSDVMTHAYEKNLAMFIRDIRAEFGKPKLPFSIATTGHGGMEVTLEKRPTLAGQLAVADPEKYPEFAGNVFTVDSRPFQRSVEESPKSDGSHWNNNGETLWLIGTGMGEGMVEMIKSEE